MNDAAISSAVSRGTVGTVGTVAVGRKSASTKYLLLSTDTTTDHKADKTAASSSLKNFLNVLLTLTEPNETLFAPTTPSNLACNRNASSRSTDTSRRRLANLDDDNVIAANAATDLIQCFMFIIFKPIENHYGSPSTNSDRSQAIDHTFLQLSSPCTFAFLLEP